MTSRQRRGPAATSWQGVENNGARLFFKVCSFRMSAHRAKWQYGKFQLDKRKFFFFTLLKHEQFSEGSCGYSKWAPEQPGFSPCWARGPPGLPSNPRYSMTSWKQSLGRICKHHILDININILDGQLLVYFYFVWECYEVVTFSVFHFVSAEWHFPHRLKLWAPARFQLLQITLKSSPPCQTDWPERTSLLLQTSQCRLRKSQMFQKTFRWVLLGLK